MRKFVAAGVFLSWCAMTVSAGAAIIHDESVNGDISGDRMHPTTYTLAPGVNSVIATTSANDQEYITLVVPTGYRLASLVLASYVSDNGIAFIGMQAGSTFTEDASNPNVANLLGWAHFGTDFGNIGQDILDDMGTAFGVIGFTPPLPAGPYTYWIQQFDFDLTTYQFDFVVEPVPQVPGDMNHDGSVTAADVPGFVQVLLAIDTSPTQVAAADVNQSGTVNGADIAPFEDALIP